VSKTTHRFDMRFSTSCDLYVHSSSVTRGYFTREGDYVETEHIEEVFDPPRKIPFTPKPLPE
jgi:hypothetical protein